MGSVSRIINKSPSKFKKLLYSTIPFEYRYNSKYRNTLNFIRNSQWLPKEELVEIQLKKLKDLINHSYKNVPYYKNLFDKNSIIPSDIRKTEDLINIPLLDKDTIINNYNDLQAKNISEKIEFRTSGSSGLPLKFLGTDSMYKQEAAFVSRAIESQGGQLYNEKSIWLRRYSPTSTDPIFKVDNELNRIYLSPFHLNKNTLIEYVKIINKSKSRILIGYPSSIYILSILLEKSQEILPYIEVIHCASEKMLNKWKIKIEKVFKQHVKMHYGMMEKVSMHFQCDKSDLYHESLEYGVTEFRETQNGDFQVIGTGFLNYKMPFIRYKMNDLAIVNKSGTGNCICGRGLPLTVDDFIGREDDLLNTQNGFLVPSVNIYTMMYKLNNLKMFKIVQSKDFSIDVFIALNNNVNIKNTVDSIKKGLRQRLGKIKISIEIVDEIKRNKKTGKIRSIINQSIQ